MSTPTLDLSTLEIEAFCRRWRIEKLALFGSALTENFTTESDLDVLISFNHEVNWGLFDHIQMEQELAEMVGRPVDLVTERSLLRSENWIRKQAILESSQVIFDQVGASYDA